MCGRPRRMTSWLAGSRKCSDDRASGGEMNDIVIRAATPGDLPRVALLAGELVRMHHAVDPARFLLPDRVEEGYAWWLERELGRPEAAVIVATVADKIVGYAYGT